MNSIDVQSFDLAPIPVDTKKCNVGQGVFTEEMSEFLEIVDEVSGVIKEPGVPTASPVSDNLLEPIPIDGPNTVQVEGPYDLAIDPSYVSAVVSAFPLDDENYDATASFNKRPFAMPRVPHAKRRCSGLDKTNLEETNVVTSDSSTEGGSSAGSSAVKFRKYQKDQWQDRLQDLIEFKHEHGHCLVPHTFPENPNLAQWVKRQRYQYKLKNMGRHSTLTEDRTSILEDMGFVWDSHKAAWYERLDALKKYKTENGHCSVPAHDSDKTLAIWVKCQRRQYRLWRQGKKSTMNEERVKRLNDLGFVWNPRNLLS